MKLSTKIAALSAAALTLGAFGGDFAHAVSGPIKPPVPTVVKFDALGLLPYDSDSNEWTGTITNQTDNCSYTVVANWNGMIDLTRTPKEPAKCKHPFTVLDLDVPYISFVEGAYQSVEGGAIFGVYVDISGSTLCPLAIGGTATGAIDRNQALALELTGPIEACNSN